jgi:hypothetical protein
MPKVTKLPSKQDSVTETLEMLLEKAKAGEITAFMAACKCSDGDVATSYANLNWGARMELIGHFQVDVTRKMIEENYVTG